ncbi:glycoside hydrolase family 30 protein [Rhodoplanes roseus]|uniref:Glucosylceramidase n=1 Tax=Rhodoplanes roseus TaxID=29409 RepID=A0A327KN21_9BRAD|nr:glycoside hydrolase family 30 beta sandwich domain-containing protein [Rhodoplanes roseus]RAI39374.1 glucosylceramidase [Rhodoplanes roseus]
MDDAEAGAFTVETWTTTADRSRLLAPRRGRPENSDRPADAVLDVRPAERHQVIDGFGFALTGGSAELIRGLAPDDRKALLIELFSTLGGGIGISLLRIGIGATDLSRTAFSLDDCPPGETDPELTRFSLDAGDADVVPLLKEILAIGPGVRVLATPWSAPPWMKTNGSFVAGSLRPECYRSYAAYLVAFVRGMRARGIPVVALTPQNEPLNVKNEPSMIMTAAEQAAFIGDHLGPALRDAGLGDVELFCHDHNCDRPDYPLAVLADPRAKTFVSGVAWHLYAGTPDVLGTVAARHPGLKMYLTEQWVGDDGSFGGDLAWHVRNVLVGTIRNGGRAVLEWNLAGDPAHGPHTPRGSAHCVGALTIDGADIVRNVSYYVIAHLARFVPPGSVRVFSTAVEALPNVAFATPDGRLVLLVLNDRGEETRFDIRCDGRTARQTLAAGAVATCVWPAAAGRSAVGA